MKIICVDNFDRESVSDMLICENVDIAYGVQIVDLLNKKYSGEYSFEYYKLVEDDYELYEFKP